MQILLLLLYLTGNFSSLTWDMNIQAVSHHIQMNLHNHPFWLFNHPTLSHPVLAVSIVTLKIVQPYVGSVPSSLSSLSNYPPCHFFISALIPLLTSSWQNTLCKQLQYKSRKIWMMRLCSCTYFGNSIVIMLPLYL